MFCWLAVTAAACGSSDAVDIGGDCSGGKKCKPGLICEPRTLTCQVGGTGVDAALGDGRVGDARVFDGGVADAGTADARTFDGGTVALNTTITSGPSGTINTTDASFTFTCNTPPCTFECSLDGAGFTTCTSPRNLTGLAATAHTFQVRAIDAAQNVDPTPAEAIFTVSVAGLVTVITDQPANPTNQTSASFEFECRVDGVPANDCTFACVLDGVSAACTSAKTYDDLTVTTHTFAVTATRNAVPGAADSFMWTIDTAPPTVAIITGPTGGAVSGPSATFTYEPSETAATFTCTLDGSSVACTAAGAPLSGMDAGPHTFTVAVTDLAGNPSAPASASFTVDDAGPVVDITAPGASSGPSGQLHFTATDESPPVTTTCDFGAGATDCTDGFNYNGLAAGANTVTIVATDSLGNTSTTEHSFNVVVNGPVVQIFGPTEGSTHCAGNLVLLFDTIPADAQVTYQCTQNGSPFECFEGGVQLTNLIGGLNEIVVNATDGNNLTGSATLNLFIDKTRPQVFIVAPAANAQVCATGTISYTTQDSGLQAPITISECTITAASGGSVQCTGSGGTINYTNLPGGLNTISIRGTDQCGNVSEPAELRTFNVDRTGPTVMNLVAAAGGQNTGAATLTYAGVGETLADATGGIAFATLPAPPTEPTAAQLLPSCDCGPASCSCTQLAAGQNVLAVRGLDQCGNAGPFVTTTVDASYGPYSGHEVAIGHDYSDAATPTPVLGNSVALTPFVHDPLAIGRTAPRVLALRLGTIGVPDDVVKRVTDAITTRLALRSVTWSAANPQHYTEFSDPNLLTTLLPGHDVLLVYSDGESDVDYSDIGFDWEPILAPFLDDGGVAIALGAATPTLNPFEAPGKAPRVVPGTPPESTIILEAYPDDLVPGENFFIAQGMPAFYDPPGGTIPVFVTSDAAATVFEAETAFSNDGVVFFTEPVITDELFPTYTIDVTVQGDVAPGLPDCIGPVVGLVTTAGGTFDITTTGTHPRPTGTFTCWNGPEPGRGQSSRPLFGCTATASTFTMDTTVFSGGVAHVDIALTQGGRPVRTGSAQFVVDDALFVNAFPIAQDICAAGYNVSEPMPEALNICGEIPFERPWRSVTCILERSNVNGGFDELARKSGTACGATPVVRGEEDSGFESESNITVDWSNEIAGANLDDDDLRMRVVVEDYHSNVRDVASATWLVSSSGRCSP